MIRFFKYFDLIQVIALFIFLIIIRLPVFISDTPFVLQQLDWMLIGDRMNRGFMMYKDIYDITAPLSSMVYSFMDLIGAGTQRAYFIVSTLLVYIQALLSCQIFNANNVYKERSSLPGLFYILFSSLFIDFYTLSPLLLGNTFLILMLHFLFQQVRNVITEDLMFYTGLSIGIAALFASEFSVFILFAFTSTVFFANPDLRKAMILIIGFAFPFMIAGVYYFFGNAFEEFITQFIQTLFSYNREFYTKADMLTIIAVTPVLLLLISFFFILNSGKFINYQYNLIKIMLTWLVFSILFCWITLEISANTMLIFAPALAFFVAHLFLLTGRKAVEESIFWVSVVAILGINYGALYNFLFKDKQKDLSAMLFIEKEPDIKGKKIVVLGPGKTEYYKNELATPYLNWQLSEKLLSNLEEYDKITLLYRNFNRDLPEVIIDEKDVAEGIFERIPALGTSYQKQEDNLYVKK